METATPELPFSLLLMLLLRFFVITFVLFLAVSLGVFLFVRCIAYSCQGQLLFYLYGRTWTFKTKRVFLLILLLAKEAQLPFNVKVNDDPVLVRAPPTKFRDSEISLLQRILFARLWFIADLISDIQNAEYARVRRMLLVTCGNVERYRLFNCICCFCFCCCCALEND